MIETHAHIYAEQFKEDISEVLERAQEVGVQKIIMPNIDHTSIDAMLELEHRNPSLCIATMGLHPCSVNKHFEKELYVVEEWINKRPFVAIGEIGTDLYWDKTFKDQQIEAFKIQADWAKKLKKPIIIHCRESLDLTIDLVESMKDQEFTGVFHCFNGTVEQAQRIVDMGFYLGLGGVSTFKNAGMDKVVPELDAQRIVLETDSPYLSPEPYRGKRNEPSNILYIAEMLEKITTIPLKKISRVTTKNAIELFDL